MTVYTLLCLNPFLILFVPNLIIAGVIASNYYAFAKSTARKSLTVSQANTSKKSIDPSSFRPEQVHYRKNMQFIQNTMGMYCDMYEQLCYLNAKIDWTNEKQTVLVLQLNIASAVALALMYTMIPWNIVALVVGHLVFFANTSMGRALQTVAMQYMQRHSQTFNFRKFLLYVVQSFSRSSGSSIVTESLDSDAMTVTVECYENQRWWAGLGWIAHLLRTERAAWSNFKGDLALKPKDELDSAQQWIALGAGLMNVEAQRERVPSDLASLTWEWVPGSQWHLDTAWASTEKQQVDAEGWVYGDHNWQRVKKKSSQAGNLTRRRRWIRQAFLVNDKENE
jgi:hypothetical protein